MSELVPVTSKLTKPQVAKRFSVRQSTWLKVLAWCLAVLAVIGTSTAFGWWLASSTVIAGLPNSESVIVEVPAALGVSGDVVMPDVRGLPPDVALEVLADSGIDVASVSTETRPAAGPSEIVLQQSPVFGTADPGEINLIVSAPASVPNLVGLNTDEAVSRLIELGARVEKLGVYDPDAAEDVVRAVTPAAGSDLPDIVTLTVTTAPTKVDLATIERDDCSTQSSIVIDGKSHTSVITCDSTSSGRAVSWQFGKAVDVLTGTLAVPDSEDPGASAIVQVLGDGKQLGRYTVAYGEPRSFTQRTTGVLRLTLVITAIGDTRVEVAIANASAVGSGVALSGLPRE